MPNLLQSASSASAVYISRTAATGAKNGNIPSAVADISVCPQARQLLGQVVMDAGERWQHDGGVPAFLSDLLRDKTFAGDIKELTGLLMAANQPGSAPPASVKDLLAPGCHAAQFQLDQLRQLLTDKLEYSYPMLDEFRSKGHNSKILHLELDSTLLQSLKAQSPEGSGSEAVTEVAEALHKAIASTLAITSADKDVQADVTSLKKALRAQTDALMKAALALPVASKLLTPVAGKAPDPDPALIKAVAEGLHDAAKANDQAEKAFTKELGRLSPLSEGACGAIAIQAGLVNKKLKLMRESLKAMEQAIQPARSRMGQLAELSKKAFRAVEKATSAESVGTLQKAMGNAWHKSPAFFRDLVRSTANQGMTLPAAIRHVAKLTTSYINKANHAVQDAARWVGDAHLSFEARLEKGAGDAVTQKINSQVRAAYHPLLVAMKKHQNASEKLIAATETLARATLAYDKSPDGVSGLMDEITEGSAAGSALAAAGQHLAGGLTPGGAAKKEKSEAQLREQAQLMFNQQSEALSAARDEVEGCSEELRAVLKETAERYKQHDKQVKKLRTFKAEIDRAERHFRAAAEKMKGAVGNMANTAPGSEGAGLEEYNREIVSSQKASLRAQDSVLELGQAVQKATGKPVDVFSKDARIALHLGQYFAQMKASMQADPGFKPWLFDRMVGEVVNKEIPGHFGKKDDPDGTVMLARVMAAVVAAGNGTLLTPATIEEVMAKYPTAGEYLAKAGRSSMVGRLVYASVDMTVERLTSCLPRNLIPNLSILKAALLPLTFYQAYSSLQHAVMPGQPAPAKEAAVLGASFLTQLTKQVADFVLPHMWKFLASAALTGYSLARDGADKFSYNLMKDLVDNATFAAASRPLSEGVDIVKAAYVENKIQGLKMIDEAVAVMTYAASVAQNQNALQLTELNIDGDRAVQDSNVDSGSLQDNSDNVKVRKRRSDDHINTQNDDIELDAIQRNFFAENSVDKINYKIRQYSDGFNHRVGGIFTPELAAGIYMDELIKSVPEEQRGARGEHGFIEDLDSKVYIKLNISRGELIEVKLSDLLFGKVSNLQYNILWHPNVSRELRDKLFPNGYNVTKYDNVRIGDFNGKYPAGEGLKAKYPDGKYPVDRSPQGKHPYGTILKSSNSVSGNLPGNFKTWYYNKITTFSPGTLNREDLDLYYETTIKATCMEIVDKKDPVLDRFRPQLREYINGGKKPEMLKVAGYTVSDAVAFRDGKDYLMINAFGGHRIVTMTDEGVEYKEALDWLFKHMPVDAQHSYNLANDEDGFRAFVLGNKKVETITIDEGKTVGSMLSEAICKRAIIDFDTRVTSNFENTLDTVIDVAYIALGFIAALASNGAGSATASFLYSMAANAGLTVAKDVLKAVAADPETGANILSATKANVIGSMYSDALMFSKTKFFDLLEKKGVNFPWESHMNSVNPVKDTIENYVAFKIANDGGSSSFESFYSDIPDESEADLIPVQIDASPQPAKDTVQPSSDITSAPFIDKRKILSAITGNEKINSITGSAVGQLEGGDIRRVASAMHNAGFTDVRVRAMHVWDDNKQSASQNHFAWVGKLNGQDYILDFARNKSTGTYDKPEISKLSEWTEKYNIKSELHRVLYTDYHLSSPNFIILTRDDFYKEYLSCNRNSNTKVRNGETELKPTGNPALMFYAAIESGDFKKDLQTKEVTDLQNEQKNNSLKIMRIVADSLKEKGFKNIQYRAVIKFDNKEDKTADVNYVVVAENHGKKYAFDLEVNKFLKQFNDPLVLSEDEWAANVSQEADDAYIMYMDFTNATRAKYAYDEKRYNMKNHHGQLFKGETQLTKPKWATGWRSSEGAPSRAVTTEQLSKKLDIQASNGELLIKIVNHQPELKAGMNSDKNAAKNIIDPVITALNKEGFCNFRHRIIHIWDDSKQQEGKPHFVVVAQKYGKDYVFDLSAQKAIPTMSDPLILSNDAWLKKYQGEGKDKRIIYHDIALKSALKSISSISLFKRFSTDSLIAGEKKLSTPAWVSEVDSPADVSPQEPLQSQKNVRQPEVSLTRKYFLRLGDPEINRLMDAPADHSRELMVKLEKTLKEKGVTDIKYRGIYIWTEGEKYPKAHFVLTGKIGGEDKIFDPEGGKLFNHPGGSYIMDPQDWLNKYQSMDNAQRIIYQDYGYPGSAGFHFAENMLPSDKLMQKAKNIAIKTT
ncbi:hypothetical protein ACP3TC_01890 [Winslowiella sp. 2C04]|uniref:hypothetical protein n=1 Tax=Winslowiella sp. 2C04 TaxID=3416179 RepID=UPI003CF3EFB5